MPTQIYLGADHGGFALKNLLLSYLQAKGYAVVDCGAGTLNEDDDYPEFAFSVAEKVATDTQQKIDSYGILLCRSGVGMTIAANKVVGVRAATIRTAEQAIHAREHDGITVLSLPADELEESQARSIIDAFLRTPVSTESRHQRRIDQIKQFETKYI